ncbi:MAG TPA: serine/threonine-protein kinase [Vicinamibacteria bacterium]|nr:serine/threonine-protein kinase [Vicinamibacteria bacterium]
MALPPHIGRYRVLGLLGQGAMGIVYRGRDEALERDVALKVMSLGQADADARGRFQREAKAAGRLQHPNIITIYELGEHQGSPFMALELLEGVDLQRAIEAGIRPDPKVTLPIVLQLLAGLGHAHENGIVHRDVKPSNIFLPRGRPAKIMDFGVARLAGGATAAGMVIGTPNYMSPEQVQARSVDGRSDLFSAGLILYELVTGEKAYQADTVVALLFKIVQEDPNLDLIPEGGRWERLRQVLARSVAKQPDDRYPDAQAMAADLAKALKDLGGSADWTTAADQGLLVKTAPRVTPPAPVDPPVALSAPPAPAPPSSSRLPIAIAGTLGVLAVGLLGFAALVLVRPSPPAPVPHPPVTAAPVLPASPLPLSPTPPPSGGPSAPPTRPTPAPERTAPPSKEETPPPALSPVEARMDRANDLIEKGRYAEALAVARAILERDPGNAAAKALAGDAEAAIVIETCVKNAKAALNAGDKDRALEEIKKGLAVNPSEGRLLALFREATQ